MGGTCSTNLGEEMRIRGFGGETWRKGNTVKTEALMGG
jgi:hypothetical protein